MKRYGSELLFISRIKKDGSGVDPINNLEDLVKMSQGTLFELRPLSITHETYVASEMSTFVVKLKNPPPKKY